jgi:hypothetical protein
MCQIFPSLKTQTRATNSGTVVEHLPPHPKVKGLCLATHAVTWRLLPYPNICMLGKGPTTTLLDSTPVYK